MPYPKYSWSGPLTRSIGLVLSLVSACSTPDPRCLESSCRDAALDAGGSDDASVDADLPDAATDAGSDTGTDAGEPHDAGGGTDAGVALEPVPSRTAIAGPLTITSYGALPFLTPASIDEVLLGPFSIGREFFAADWVEAPNATRPSIDGVGPLFHATSCVACHPASGRPASLLADGSVAFGMLFRLGREVPGGGLVSSDPVFGGQLQPSAIASVIAEGTVTYVGDVDRPPGVSAASPRPSFSVATNAAYPPMHADTRALARTSPHLAGMGLLERVPDATLLAWVDVDDADGDGISGRAAIVDGSIGRFGWKAIKTSLHGQTAGAFVGDMGISSPDHPADDCTPTQTACLAATHGGEPEIDGAGIDAVDFFMAYLGVPAARRGDADPEIVRGNALFQTLGCAGCHRTTLVTGPSTAEPALANVTFHPYTDLLLHDMGEGLADPVGEGDATGAEWRTPPLWGLGLVEAAASARFLHDGRAANLPDAIAWHGGEAAATTARYLALDADDRDALLAFLRSL